MYNKSEKMKNDPEYRKKVLAMQKKWRINNPEKQAFSKRKSILKKTYGISLEEFDALSKSQNNVCAICKTNKPYRGKPEYLCIDHNHKTGKIRGLLCHSCNRGLGMLKDDVDILKNNYLPRKIWINYVPTKSKL